MTLFYEMAFESYKILLPPKPSTQTQAATENASFEAHSHFGGPVAMNYLSTELVALSHSPVSAKDSNGTLLTARFAPGARLC